FFFFFQAEDGIRDRNVTGVQTCALPILSRLDHSRANRQSKLQGTRIIQAVGAVYQITVPIAHGGVLFRCVGRFQMLSQCLDDFLHRSSLEPILLGSAPPLRSLGLTSGRSRSQILADMKEIAQEASLPPKDFPGL